MYHIYQVAINDNLEKIANQFRTTVNELKKINGIVGNVELIPNSFLIVPNKEKNQYLETYIVKKGDNMYEIAKKHYVDYKTLLELNGLEEYDYIYPEQEIVIPNKDIKIYKVQQGDSIKTLEAITGIDINEIKTPNNEIYVEKDQIVLY